MRRRRIAEDYAMLLTQVACRVGRRRAGSFRRRGQRCPVGFTLIEVLMVVAIIALLIGILLPALHQAREEAKTVRCQANLHSIGQAIQQYLNDYHGFYPPMALVPSMEVALHGPAARQSMRDVLAVFVGGEREVFHCPADRFINPKEITGGELEGITGPVTPPAGVQSWFEWQGSSYQPVPALSLVDPVTGKWRLSQEMHGPLEALTTVFGGYLAQIPIMYDYEDFHPTTGEPWGGKVLLYADFHVTSRK